MTVFSEMLAVIHWIFPSAVVLKSNIAFGQTTHENKWRLLSKGTSTPKLISRIVYFYDVFTVTFWILTSKRPCAYMERNVVFVFHTRQSGFRM